MATVGRVYVGRVYACQLITFHPTANRAVKEQELDLLSKVLNSAMVQITRGGSPLDCAHCGATEVLPSKQSCANRLKVCETTPQLWQPVLVASCQRVCSILWRRM